MGIYLLDATGRSEEKCIVNVSTSQHIGFIRRNKTPRFHVLESMGGGVYFEKGLKQ